MRKSSPDLMQPVRPTESELAATFLFKDIEPVAALNGSTAQTSVLKTLAQSCAKLTVKQGGSVPLIQRRRRYLYFIRSGYLTVEYPANHVIGRPGYFIGWRGKDQLIGEVGMLFPNHYSEAETPEVKVTDECELIQIPAAQLMAAMADAPLIYRNLAMLLIKKTFVERNRTEVAQQVSASAVPPVAKTLLNLLKDRGCRPGSQIINGTVMRKAIAGYIGISRDAVGDSMRELAEDEIIKYGKAREAGTITDSPDLNDDEVLVHGKKTQLLRGDIAILNEDALESDY